MPIPIARKLMGDGLDSVPFVPTLLKIAPWLVALYLLKRFFGGRTNPSVRNMHAKVVMVTGGTSGVGQQIVHDLASRGAQIVLLTQHALSDPFIVDHIEDLRSDTNNQLITAEQVDLSSLHSIRTFATKWIDNAPPRRLDMVVLCANTTGPGGGNDRNGLTKEGVEVTWQLNYLANFHLLSILSPALRSQPPDRDVRVLFGTCSSYLGGDLLHITQEARPKKSPEKKANGASPQAAQGALLAPSHYSPGNAYATSKLALTTFALAFQKHLSAYERPDKLPMNTKVILVDPGFCRTPGTRRYLSWGSLFGLLLYLVFYPVWWLILKSPYMGAQSFLFAAMEERFSRLGGTVGVAALAVDTKLGIDGGGWLIKECGERPIGRPEDTQNEESQKKLWQFSEKMVEEAEKRGAAIRAQEKKDEKEKKEEADAEKEMKDYKEKIGKKEGSKQEGSRRSKKATG